MPRTPLILHAWRSVAAARPFGQCTRRVLEYVANELAFDCMTVEAENSASRTLETVAWTPQSSGPPPHRAPLAPADHAAIRRGLGPGVLKLQHVAPRVRAQLYPAALGADDDVRAADLRIDGAWIGFVVAARLAPARIAGAVEAELAAVLEPLANALRNDLDFRAEERQREAVEAENRELLSRLQRHDLTESVVGAEAGLRGVMEQVSKVAPTDAPVLILGETGSGKEVIARAIHKGSRRAAGPVVRVNCGAIPPELVDSELFGHERGSFTGAVAARKGWFERADGGTLFLDEIGDLPLAAQVRLLRILQDGTFERVGGHETRTVDVRLVAATHRDLLALVANGGFRQDLWFRISVFPIYLPPLRERRCDVGPLARHFAHSAGMRLAGVPFEPSPADVELLLRYSWPGNVRELAAVIERAAILGGGQRLEIARALGAGVPAPVASTAPAALAPLPAGAPGDPEPAGSLDAAMVAHIEAALAASRGRIEGPHGAAQRLGINPHTLRSRMRRLGVEWRRFRG